MSVISFIGRVEKPTLRIFANKPCLMFDVIEEYEYRFQGEIKTNKTAIPVKLWGKQADEYNNYIQAGQTVYIEGRLSITRKRSDQTGEYNTFVSVEPNLNGLRIITNPVTPEIM